MRMMNSRQVGVISMPNRPLDPRICNISLDANALDLDGTAKDDLVRRFRELLMTGTLTVLPDAECNKKGDRRRFLVEPDAHGRAAEGQPDDRLVLQGARVPGISMTTKYPMTKKSCHFGRDPRSSLRFPENMSDLTL
jgi:hypothetical protein